jgi:hypothetical protein
VDDVPSRVRAKWAESVMESALTRAQVIADTFESRWGDLTATEPSPTNGGKDRYGFVYHPLKQLVRTDEMAVSQLLAASRQAGAESDRA